MRSSEPIVKCVACDGEGIKPGPRVCRVCKGIGLCSTRKKDEDLAEALEALDELDADEQELGVFGIRAEAS